MLVLLHGVRLNTISRFDIKLITMSNDMCIFYPSDLLKHDLQGRPIIKLSTKKFENSKPCPMAATNEYLKLRAECNVAHT